MASLFKHVLLRIVLLGFAALFSMNFESPFLDPNRECGVADGIGIALTFLLFYLIWIVALLAEAFQFNRRGNFKLRNSNIIMASILPLIFLSVYLYFEIARLIK
jgi:hypothetical protein